MTTLRYMYSGTAWAKREAASTEHVFNGAQWVPVVDEEPIVDVPVAPFDTLPDMVAFLDAADPKATGTAPSSGASLDKWVDRETGATYTAPTTANQPTYRAATASEPAFVRFDGANDWLTRTGTFLPVSGGWTIYAVLRQGGLGYGGVFTQSSTTAANPLAGIDIPGNGSLRAFRRTDDGTLVSSSIPQIANAWRVMSIVSSDWNRIEVRSNEQSAPPGSATTTSSGVSTCDTTVIGGRMSYATLGTVGVPFLGDIAMLVAYTGVHDPNTRAKVTQQLATRCKIVLPSQGGTVDGPSARIITARQEISTAYGIPATQRVTGKTLPGFHNVGPDLGITYTVVNGDLSSSADNQVITNRWILGRFIPRHANVTLRNCIIANG